MTEAIKENDQSKATEEKFLLESAQRRDAKLRSEQNIEYMPRLFKPQPDNYFLYRTTE